ncbi:retinol dehydrogenase 11 [Tribolium castaneum]|uniref:WW domain-containing oxidoreductase-like Protein n=1 Tax=Tribolium castaneum TaxID=7070 RepID=D6WFR6_TRICA|nr:PREDICTED: retinol dehydrogenase 11 [Tribolium castaneum]EEZ99585.1 WW domain-containing oxidoreductase-like Protein [Tribolium castaneum]|eukprot:XP_008200076.1 PREDICTED: retinol dehydrogenase 11 [Tribolium castaneum]
MVPNLFYCIIPAVLALIGIRKLRERSWGYCRNRVPLDNKVVVITGANSGIGFEVAKELASRNAMVVLACRKLDSAKEAIERIEQELKKKLKMRAMEVDLASLLSIKQFASNVQKLYPEVHILVNNAGVAYPKNEKHLTKDGFEIHFGINHLGHFYLTNLLLDKLKKSTPSRIIIVTSSLHEKGTIDLKNLESGKNLYANSKLANAYFCKELSKRVKDTGVSVYGVCPGWVYTALFRHSIRWYHYIMVAPIAYFFMRSPKQGAQTVIYCASEPGLEPESGSLFRNCSLYKSKVNFDENLGLHLWNESERLINQKMK